MRMMIPAVALATAAMFAGVTVLADEQKIEAAETAVLEWLALVDAEEYRQSWEVAARPFRTRVTPDDWVAAVSQGRQMYGALASRSVANAEYLRQVPGLPDGHYVVLQFDARFANKPESVETVTAVLEGGVWRVTGYFIR